MTGSPTSLAWLVASGVLAGVCFSGSMLWFVVFTDRRKRAARKERPPQTTKLLRPPGHSLQLRVQKLDDRLNDLFLTLAAAGAVAGICAVPCLQVCLIVVHGSVRALIAHPRSWQLCALIAVTLGSTALWVIYFRRLLAAMRERRACRFGMRGEQAVAEAIADQKVVGAGYRSFHDIPGDGPWNIDHVVIGPSGIYVLETKTRSRRTSNGAEEEHVVEFDGQILRFPWCEDRKAARQARRNAEWLQKLLRDFLPPGMSIHPIIVVPGWYVKSLGKYAVRAMNANYLSSFIAGEPRRFTPAQLAPAVARLDQLCRDVEF